MFCLPIRMTVKMPGPRDGVSLASQACKGEAISLLLPAFELFRMSMERYVHMGRTTSAIVDDFPLPRETLASSALVEREACRQGSGGGPKNKHGSCSHTVPPATLTSPLPRAPLTGVLMRPNVPALQTSLCMLMTPICHHQARQLNLPKYCRQLMAWRLFAFFENVTFLHSL